MFSIYISKVVVVVIIKHTILLIETCLHIYKHFNDKLIDKFIRVLNERLF
jgi:hypothetical protein